MIIQKEDSEYLWIRCLNPEHEDKHASMVVNKIHKGEYPKGFGYCMSCGHILQFSEKVIDMVSNKKSICRKKKPIDWQGLQTKEYYSLEKDNIKNLALEWNIKWTYFSYYGVGTDGDSINIPMYDEESNIIGIQRRFKDGRKSCVEGSNLGLFLPKALDERSVIITEGFSDAIIATSLGYLGIGKPSAGFGEQLVRKYLENIEYKGKIIIVQDNDGAGRRSRVKLELALKDWDIRIVIPDNDLRKYYSDNGRNTTKTLLEM